MAQFNLADYETVEQRLIRFWADEKHTDARIVTVNHTKPEDRQSGVWVVEARIYMNADDQFKECPKATGWAFEVDGGSMANKTSALENCETSAIGRALANMNMSGNKRTSREEMQKVERGITPAPSKSNWLTQVEALTDVTAARDLYNQARAAKAPADVLEAIKSKAASLA
jgi:hypothetical protein